MLHLSFALSTADFLTLAFVTRLFLLYRMLNEREKVDINQEVRYDGKARLKTHLLCARLHEKGTLYHVTIGAM